MTIYSFGANCPQCRQLISESRLQQLPIVCDGCGHVCSPNQSKAKADLNSRNIKGGVVTTFILLAIFFQYGTWGQHSLNVIPLQIGDILGLNSMASKEAFAQISLEVKRYGLTDRLYSDLAKNNFANTLRLAKFRMSRNQSREALVNLSELLRLQPMDFEARYLMAKVLGDLGQIEEATKHYEFLLASKPQVRQVTVLTNYIKMLMHAELFDRARLVIENVRHQDHSAQMFMETEYKVIVARIQKQHS